MITHSSTTPGTLYIVATPIGNREDITLRALQILKSVDAILAEDTRHSSGLLTNYNIKKPLIALHAHNEASKSNDLLEKLLNGTNYALISDAGTPLISDPGYPLVKAAIDNGIQVSPIPGACAVIAALSASGLPCDTFTFLGFLPAKQTARLEKLQSINTHPHTIIFYEATHRIEACIKDIITVRGAEAPMVLAKELTKSFETIKNSTATTILAWLTEQPAHQKGEFVILLPTQEKKAPLEDNKVLSILLNELPLKQAVKLTGLITNQPKNELYQQALSIKETLKD